MRDEAASFAKKWILKQQYFYKQVKDTLRYIIEPGKRVLNINSGTGHLIQAVEPEYGVCVEESPKMLEISQEDYPRFKHVKADADGYQADETFDFVLISNIDEVVDVQQMFDNLSTACDHNTRVVIYTYSDLWQYFIRIAEKLKLKPYAGERNNFTIGDIENILELSGYELLKSYKKVLLHKNIPILSWLCNRVLIHFWPFRDLSLVRVHVARKVCPQSIDDLKVSVIVPCKNERGNIEEAITRLPKLGKHTELIFCDDKSTDGTAEEVIRLKNKRDDLEVRLVEGPGVCKSRNVWTGFDAATGDILMILDADLTVMPEELPRFLNAIAHSRGEFINGSRLVYPIPAEAMKFSNYMGNKFFSYMFSLILQQRVKDTLCGTKVIWRRDWPRIKHYVNAWGTMDRWGDYDLLFGASRNHLKIVDIPVHYQERVYGVTKMTRVFRNGLIMLKMSFWGIIKLRLR